MAIDAIRREEITIELLTHSSFPIRYHATLLDV